ncbi:MAG: BACON domain-containing protein [Vicinamibacteraceae bacterium]|nr:BACON domain-containing protein [Vicinamibacteraceae bacterium]
MQLLRSRLAALVLPATIASVLLSASAGDAQVVTNPRLVEFDPSTDHDAVSPGDNQPVVTSYTLQFYLAGATSPFQTLDFGKPAPQTDGKIRYDFSARVTAWPQFGALYEARVAAIGPGGSGVSEASNQFTVQAPCSTTVSPTSVAAVAGGGTYTIGITTGATCTWTTSGSASWATLAPTSGTGSATVTVTVASNGAASPRSIDLTVAGTVIQVTQAAAACTYSLSAASASLPATAGAGSVGVVAPSGCAWTATSSAPWLTLGDAGGGTTGSGSGNGTLSYSVTANTSTSSRSATITVAGQVHTVTQAAGLVSPAKPRNVRVVDTTEE